MLRTSKWSRLGVNLAAIASVLFGAYSVAHAGANTKGCVTIFRVIISPLSYQVICDKTTCTGTCARQDWQVPPGSGNIYSICACSNNAATQWPDFFDAQTTSCVTYVHWIDSSTAEMGCVQESCANQCTMSVNHVYSGTPPVWVYDNDYCVCP